MGQNVSESDNRLTSSSLVHIHLSRLWNFPRPSSPLLALPLAHRSRSQQHVPSVSHQPDEASAPIPEAAFGGGGDNRASLETASTSPLAPASAAAAASNAPAAGLLARTFQGHMNERNFVGLAVDQDFIACGSETNQVLCAALFFNHSIQQRP